MPDGPGPTDRPDRPAPPGSDEPARPGPDAGDGLRLELLDADAEEAIRALWAACIVIAEALPPEVRDVADPPPADLAGLRVADTREAAALIPGLASYLVRHLAGEDGRGWWARRRLRAGAEVLLRAVEPLRERLEPEEWRDPSDAAVGTAGAALADVGALLRERALEERDRELLLFLDEEEMKLQVALRPVRPAEAHVLLLERLYERVETSLLGEGLLALERAASRWWFSRWSLLDLGEEMAFGRGVREQEWSLVDRPALMLGVPVLAAFLEQGLADRFATPPRQGRMAEALLGSTVGAFVVRERAGEVSLLEDPDTGRLHRVLEHNPELEYGPGSLALGRLLPFEDGAFLRSPGMAFMGGVEETEELARRVATGIAEREEEFSPAIGLEGLISVLGSEGQGGGRKRKAAEVPRALRPASSRSKAREILRATIAALEEEGVAEKVPAGEGASEVPVPGRGSADLRYLQLQVDEVLADWLAALDRQAGGRGGGRSGRRGPRPAVAKRRKRR